METNTVNTVNHQQQITIEKDLMAAVLMRIAAETAPDHLVLVTGQIQTEMEIQMPM